MGDVLLKDPLPPELDVAKVKQAVNVAFEPAAAMTSLRPCTSLVSSTPSGFQRRKRRCIAPSN